MDNPNYGQLLESNPYAQWQAGQQADLNSQFQNQKYLQEQNATQRGTLENQQAAGMNPLLQEQQRIANQGAGYKTGSAGLEFERAKANQANVLNADQRKAALDLSEDQMKQFDQHVGELLRSDNPAERDQGAKLQSYIPAFQEARRKHQEELEKAAIAPTIKGKTDITTEQMGISAGKYEKTPRAEGKSPQTVYNSLSPDKRIGVSAMALESGVNPFTQAPLSPDERRQFQAIHDQDQRTIEANLAARLGQGAIATVGPTGSVGLGNKAPPTIGAIPGQAPAASPKAGHSLATVQSQYPGVPPEKLRELYKKKFGVDLQ